ncbi:MAG: Jag N-terminal domain-containing protein, partial [Candidatus Limnocylindria bacterium]
MTFREFTGKNVEEAIRTAMREFASDLSELDIEILSQGSRGILGVGGEEARILAAPKSAVAAADTVRLQEPEPAAFEVAGDEAASGPAPEAARVAPQGRAEGAPESAPEGGLPEMQEADDQVAELARLEQRRGTRG